MMASSLPRSSSDWVSFNVGGTLFKTTKATLSNDRESFLFRLVSSDPDLPSCCDEVGAFLIDRDPAYFSTILNYLRHGKLVIDRNLVEEGVLEEAEFYNVYGLIRLCKERIHHRDNARSDGRKTVYRVVQCHEKELSNLVSTMSDGWKFVQIVNTRRDRLYNGDGYGQDNAEFLCIVSKDYPDCPNNETPPSDKAKTLQTIGSRT